MRSLCSPLAAEPLSTLRRAARALGLCAWVCATAVLAQDPAGGPAEPGLESEPGLGAARLLALQVDRDRDGVPDRRDGCPRSGRGVRVGPDGCLILGPDVSAVTFAPGSARLAPSAERGLTGVLATLRRFPAKRIELAARAPASGAAGRGLPLAFERTGAVLDWLVGRGVPAGRIDIVASVHVSSDGQAPDPARVELRLLR